MYIFKTEIAIASSATPAAAI